MTPRGRPVNPGEHSLSLGTPGLHDASPLGLIPEKDSNFSAMKEISIRKCSEMSSYFIRCLNTNCNASFAHNLTKCPTCGTDYGHLYLPTNPTGIQKLEKHRELITKGTLSLGKGPLGINASLDHYGDSIREHLVRFTLTFGQPCLIKNGPGRQSCTGLITYVPEVIASGRSKSHTSLFPVSGYALMSPASCIWGHGFPATDNWIAYQNPGKPCECANPNCPNPVTFGMPFCDYCYSTIGTNWRDLIS